ncbi:MAG: imidazoleglycerol-phosphate dehydratase HisB [Chloroflexi bacterium]|nr:imidazoleglycerol-phosphate dehydratase HisB [Chloroflexota bacterium]
MRTTTLTRKTTETDVTLTLNLDGSGQHQIATGVGFFDHLLRHVAVHGLFDLTVQASGDLEIDPHHTVEDVTILLGQAFDRALGERRGIARMGHAWAPMDEALAFVAVDLSGRPYAVVRAEWHTPAIGQLPTSLIPHALESLAVGARMNLHARVEYGRDDHHQAEALFKALGRALDAATRPDERRAGQVPSTKGTLSN